MKCYLMYLFCLCGFAYGSIYDSEPQVVARDDNGKTLTTYFVKSKNNNEIGYVIIMDTRRKDERKSCLMIPASEVDILEKHLLKLLYNAAFGDLTPTDEEGVFLSSTYDFSTCEQMDLKEVEFLYLINLKISSQGVYVFSSAEGKDSAPFILPYTNVLNLLKNLRFYKLRILDVYQKQKESEKKPDFAKDLIVLK